jgi:hypothetical protein
MMQRVGVSFIAEQRPEPTLATLFHRAKQWHQRPPDDCENRQKWYDDG